MNPKLDEFGKVTVSLGGVCPLRCSHCYTIAPTFRADPKRSVDETLHVLREIGPEPSVVCLSGDTDPFLRPDLALEFLTRAGEEVPGAHLMYTTRLIPPERVRHGLLDLGDRLAQQERLLLGAVSLVTRSYPNSLESARLVPSSSERIELLASLSHGQQPVVLALRPTLPFAVVSAAEVSSILSSVRGVADAVLGEVLLLDEDGFMADGLGIPPSEPSDAVERLTFLDQEARWRKRHHANETEFARDQTNANGLPYFLRSISAIRFFASYWDFAMGTSRFRKGDPMDLSAEAVAP